MDNFKCRHEGNQLVELAKDGTDGNAVHYEYDRNGNKEKDHHKQIT